MYFARFASWVLVYVIGIVDLTMVVGTIDTSFCCYDMSLMNDLFYHNWYKLMLIWL
jgi:hypothetical protein